MSTALVLTLISLVLMMMVGVAITLQNIEKNKKERRRLEAGLRTRSRNFQFMLDSFPEGFLNKELRALVAQCLLEVDSQLVSLDHKNKNNLTAQYKSQQLLAQIKNEPTEHTMHQLSDLEQIKDIQKLLVNLGGFITKLATNERINSTQAKAYHQKIDHLHTQTTIDAVEETARQAIHEKKFKLAIHYLQMAIDKMNQDSAIGLFEPRIEKLQRRIKECHTHAEQAAIKRDEADKEWDQAEEGDTSWKKNKLYD